MNEHEAIYVYGMVGIFRITFPLYLKYTEEEKQTKNQYKNGGLLFYYDILILFR